MLLFSIGEAGEAEARTREGSINPAAKKNFIIPIFLFSPTEYDRACNELRGDNGKLQNWRAFQKDR